MERADDATVREYARLHGFPIVTKDADFSDLGILGGFPPYVVWIRRGNCTAADIEALLLEHAEAVQALEMGGAGVLVLY